ncbi:MAG: hypothetical protein IJF12_03335 [Alphaproteobacteria bacterium]|nr:hypothetical protein [Alphaproteobacteria bacterium]MBQ4156232.1 hypothetical protein [Clostridia bacterium]MBQ7659843.1 hypothetical protein [Alphaproteobacteria bacterium]
MLRQLIINLGGVRIYAETEAEKENLMHDIDTTLDNCQHILEQINVQRDF